MAGNPIATSDQTLGREARKAAAAPASEEERARRDVVDPARPGAAANAGAAGAADKDGPPDGPAAEDAEAPGAAHDAVGDAAPASAQQAHDHLQDDEIEDLSTQVTSMREHLEEDRKKVADVSTKYTSLEERIAKLQQLSELLSVRYNPFLEGAEGRVFDGERNDLARLLPGLADAAPPSPSKGAASSPSTLNPRASADAAAKAPPAAGRPGAELVRVGGVDIDAMRSEEITAARSHGDDAADVVEAANAREATDPADAAPQVPERSAASKSSADGPLADQSDLECQGPLEEQVDDVVAHHAGRMARPPRPPRSAAPDREGDAHEDPPPKSASGQAAPDGAHAPAVPPQGRASESRERAPSSADAAGTRPVPRVAPDVHEPIDVEMALRWFEHLLDDVEPPGVFLLLDHYHRLGWVTDARHAWLSALAEGLGERAPDATWASLGLAPQRLLAMHRVNLRFLDLLAHRRGRPDDVDALFAGQEVE